MLAVAVMVTVAVRTYWTTRECRTERPDDQSCQQHGQRPPTPRRLLTVTCLAWAPLNTRHKLSFTRTSSQLSLDPCAKTSCECLHKCLHVSASTSGRIETNALRAPTTALRACLESQLHNANIWYTHAEQAQGRAAASSLDVATIAHGHCNTSMSSLGNELLADKYVKQAISAALEQAAHSHLLKSSDELVDYLREKGDLSRPCKELILNASNSALRELLKEHQRKYHNHQQQRAGTGQSSSHGAAGPSVQRFANQSDSAYFSSDRDPGSPMSESRVSTQAY